MSDTTFMKMNADRYIRMALEEDITSEDISTNCVMPEYQKGQVDLQAGRSDLWSVGIPACF